jgi:hypothetical protein
MHQVAPRTVYSGRAWSGWSMLINITFSCRIRCWTYFLLNVENFKFFPYLRATESVSQYHIFGNGTQQLTLEKYLTFS